MLLFLFILFIILLALKIFFSTKKLLFFKYLLTPLTTLSIVMVPLLFLYGNSSRYAVLILAALIFSIVGDIFNMFEDDVSKYLAFGIVFFMAAHLFYIINFIRDYSFSFFHIIVIGAIISVIAVSAVLFKFESIVHKIMVGIYSIMVSATMFFAIGSFNGRFDLKWGLISLGAFLLWLSDTVLGIHLFRRKLKYQSLYVWGLYAPGQFLIALSCFY